MMLQNTLTFGSAFLEGMSENWALVGHHCIPLSWTHRYFPYCFDLFLLLLFETCEDRY